MPRLLLLLPQLPQDPTSGAARAMRLTAELLARAGWSVRALAVTATESAAPVAPADFLRGLGLTLTRRLPNRGVYARDRAVFETTGAHGIHYQLLDTAAHSPLTWAEAYGAQFNRLFARELATQRPDVIYAFGGSPADVERYRKARAAGVKVVLGLHNHGYLTASWLQELDGLLTCSEFLRRTYREALEADSIALPPPIDPAETVAAEREPVFFTAVNPTLEKGAYFLARLAEELSITRPDVPMLFIESRGSAGALVQAGLAGGFDLRRHENLMFSPAVANPADVFRHTRVLLAPSVWAEPFGRVAAEALLNGVPPIVSDRGGLPEAANGGGFVLPLPDSLTLKTTTPVAAADVAPWLELMLKLADDPDFYAEASRHALAASHTCRLEILAPRYLGFFSGLLAAPEADDSDRAIPAVSKNDSV